MYTHILNGNDDRFRVAFSNSKTKRKRGSYITSFYKGGGNWWQPRAENGV